MLKRDLVNSVSDKIDGHLKKDISQAIEIILESIADALVEDRRVEIRGFGSLCVRMRKSRSTKNPRTSKMMHIPARKTVHFTMSKSIKDPLVKSDTSNDE